MDLPGVDVESVDLDVEQNVLTIKAERKNPVGEGTGMFASERPRGVFSRHLRLGDALETENVKAGYDAGVLTVRIPVAEQAKPRRIEIETSDQQQISAA
jgi:HSP20 family protein